MFLATSRSVASFLRLIAFPTQSLCSSFSSIIGAENSVRFSFMIERHSYRDRVFFLCGLPLKLGVRKLTKTINLMETKWDLARLEWFGGKVRLNSFSWAPNKNKTFGSLASSNAAQKVLAFKSIIPVRIWPELNEISCSGRQSIAA